MRQKLYWSFLIFFLFFALNLHSQLPSKQIPEKNQNTINEYLQLVETYKSEGNTSEEAKYLNKVAFEYWECNSLNEAAAYFKQSLEINKSNGNTNGIKVISTNLGKIYSDAHMYSQAIEYFKATLQIDRSQKKKDNICADLINIATAQKDGGMYNDALSSLNEANDLAQELNDIKKIKSVYLLMAETYEKLGDTEKSFEYHGKYSAIDKHIQKEEMNEMENIKDQALADKMQAEQDKAQLSDTLQDFKELTEAQRMQLTLQQQEKEILELKVSEQNAKLEHERLVKKSIIGLSLFLVLIAVLLFIGFRMKQKTSIKLAKQNKEILEQQEIINKKNQNITKSLNYGKRLQDAMLPPVTDIKKFFTDSMILFMPRDIVSGDFYWLSGKRLSSVIARVQENEELNQNESDDFIVVGAVDCTGHGVPGAFMSSIGYNLMHEIISRGILEPQKILSVLNIGVRNYLKQDETDNRDGMDAAICTINKKKNIMEFAGAKNPLLYIQEGELFQIKGDYLSVGGLQREDEKRSYVKHTIKIDKPTTFYIYSDGYQDQIGGDDGRKFMSKKFKELLLDIYTKPMEEQKRILVEQHEKWLGYKYRQVDDILIIGFRWG
ncbi:MAG: SpoIIE family protein phosphatase [Bacteroidales bacterium]|nr:SpoIIE family protein phosphatase [Bacteroidales bacterium]